MGMMRRAARRTVRRTAVVGTAVVAGAVAASAGKQQAQAQQAAPAPEQTSDPAQVLKDRLANGEITLEEYNQMLEALKK
jgi:uncharacterized membrane protein